VQIERAILIVLLPVLPHGEADKLIGMQEIGIGFGFCSSQEAITHFGLGELT
jgi:hypothetical protein